MQTNVYLKFKYNSKLPSHVTFPLSSLLLAALEKQDLQL